MSSPWLVCVALLCACAPSADGTAPSAAPNSALPTGPGGAPGADAAQPVQADARQTADASGVVDAVPALPPDARKAYPQCSTQVRNTQACGHLDFDSKWITAWKDGWPCTICFTFRNGQPDYTAQASGCYVTGDTPTGPASGLCVGLCGECRE